MAEAKTHISLTYGSYCGRGYEDDSAIEYAAPEDATCSVCCRSFNQGREARMVAAAKDLAEEVRLRLDDMPGQIRCALGFFDEASETRAAGKGEKR